MKIYPENYAVITSFAFTDLNGDAIEPTAVKAVLYDGDDQLVHDYGSLTFDLSSGKIDITVDGDLNILGEGQKEMARILRVTFETSAGDVRKSSSYIVQAEMRLELMVNSFVTIESAEIISRTMPNLLGWSSADDDQRYAGLISAFNRLTRIPMKFRQKPTGLTYIGDYPDVPANDPMWPERYREPPETIIPAQAWPYVTATEFLAWPSYFTRAVRNAQVAEAASILENDVTERRHRQGIISETVGESSIMLRGGRLNLPVSSQALEYLTGFIYYNSRIARV